jgi:uncharacterized protein YbcI
MSEERKKRPSKAGSPTRGKVEEEIGRELLAIHHDTYGKGAAEVLVYLHDDSVLVILDGLELQQNEEFMIGAGMADKVVQIRTSFQEAIETTFRAAVERATGRRVISFASITKLDPNYAAEVFRLAPAEESARNQPVADSEQDAESD